MVTKNLLYFLFCPMLLLAACGGGDNFTVIGEVEGLGTQNLHAVYRTGNRYNQITTAALDSKFTFTGVSEKPVVIDIYTRLNVPVGTLVARNGETVEVKFKLNEPGYMQAKGSDYSERIARFRTENASAINAADVAAVNAAVTRYVSANPKDFVSACLLTSLFDVSANPVLADSLVSLIDPTVVSAFGSLQSFNDLLFAANDSLSTFEPMKLYTTGDSVTTVAANGSKGVFLAVLEQGDTEPYDSLASRLNRLQKDNLKTLRVVELSVARDTTAWRTQVGDVKPVYTRCWEPGELSSPTIGRLGLRTLPWYMVADSTGAVVYAGRDYDDAVLAVESR